MKDVPGFEKTMGDRYAIEHFGERMQAMEFTTFRYHRWFKLVKDEVLLSFGLIDSRTVWNAYALYGDSANTDAFFLRYYASGGASILDLDALRIYEGMKMRDPDHVFCWYPVHDPHLNEMERIFSTMVEPVFSRIHSIRDAFVELHWLWFICQRNYPCGKIDIHAAPTVENYQIPCHYRECNSYFYFHIQDELERAFTVFSAMRGFKSRPDVLPGFEQAKKMLTEEDLADPFWNMIRKPWKELEVKIQKDYTETLAQIRRKPKLVPDCCDTLWDRDQRHPIDIRRELEDRFARCAPYAAQGNYTIVRI